MKDGTYVIPYAGGQEVTRGRPSQVTAQAELIMRDSARQWVSMLYRWRIRENTLISSIDLFILIKF